MRGGGRRRRDVFTKNGSPWLLFEFGYLNFNGLKHHPKTQRNPYKYQKSSNFNLNEKSRHKTGKVYQLPAASPKPQEYTLQEAGRANLA
jgi:hypothetical protein